jgi:hypothetical protein
MRPSISTCSDAPEGALGYKLQNVFLDVADMAPLCPQANIREAGLDEWIDWFKLEVFERHNASADALATAELALILFSRAAAADSQSVEFAAALESVETPSAGTLLLDFRPNHSSPRLRQLGLNDNSPDQWPIANHSHLCDNREQFSLVNISQSVRLVSSVPSPHSELVGALYRDHRGWLLAGCGATWPARNGPKT